MTNSTLSARPARKIASIRPAGVAAATALLWLGGAAAARAELSYTEQVLPLMEKYCFDCHGDGADKGGLTLDHWASDAERESDRHVWKTVLKNVDMEVMPPPKRKSQPSEAERALIAEWIESVVFRYDPDNPDPGRVTIRRLNRQEYNNTVRDLMGVRFQPADDFPPDDTGYGFDTVGDALSLSPLLLEKYLKAAEQVAGAAIRTEDPPKPKRRYGVDELRGPGVRDGSRVLASTGEVEVTHEFEREAEYVIRVLAGADQAGPEPAKMALGVAGKYIHTFDVENRPREMRVFERRVKMQPGRHAIRAKFTNDFFDPDERDPERRDRNLHVRAIEIEGPMSGVVVPLPDFHRRVFGDLEITEANRLPTARRILREFASRAYRRKVPESEVDRLMRFVQLGYAQGGKYAFERGIQYACQAVLTSPFFLYRGEVQPDPDNPEATYRIDEYSLASRLSYFLWSSLPDDELFLHATRGTLRDNLEAQVRRMLADPKADALTANFAGQWLQLRNMELVQPDRAIFQSFDNDLRRSMRRETELLFGHVMAEDLPVTELLDARYSFVDERLARHYGIDGVKGGEFRKVSLEGTPRRGVLTHGSILTLTSNPTRTSPVKRGKWILDNILGTPPPEAPPGVPQLDGNKELTGTLRQRLEQHRDDPNCASCHALMDPLGLAYEHFDAVGAWRDKDGDEAVDPRGELVSGEKVNSHEELQAVLVGAKRGDFLRCSAEMMLTYALGRGLEFYDKPAVEGVVERMEGDGLKFSALVLGVVESVPFQYRRGDGQRVYD